MYLICEDQQGLVLIDQHALHEKKRFEEIKLQFQSGPLAVQRLLVPRIIRIARELEPVVSEHSDFLLNLGFEVELFGNGDLSVQSRPAILDEDQVEGVLIDALRTLLEAGESPSLEPVLHHLFATLACHSAVRANQRLTDHEALHLLDKLDELRQGWTCPTDGLYYFA